MLVFLTIFSFPLDSYLKFSSSYYALLIQNINPILHIRCKLIQVIPTQQPNRVLIHKPTHIRLVIPEEVIMQPSLAIGILVLQAKGLVWATACLLSRKVNYSTVSAASCNQIWIDSIGFNFFARIVFV